MLTDRLSAAAFTAAPGGPWNTKLDVALAGAGAARVEV